MNHEIQIQHSRSIDSVTRYRVICNCGFTVGLFTQRVEAALVKLEHQNFHIEQAIDRLFAATGTLEP